MNLKQKKLILFIFVFFAIAISQLQFVQANIISTGSGNRIHFINTKGATGSDAIILESNGHYALIDMGEDYDFPDGSDPRYPSRVGISTNNGYVLEDRLFRHMKYLGVKKLDFILGTHVHSDHIGGADEILKRYPVGKLYLKKYTDERITSKWRLWDNLFNYDNALNVAREKGVTIVQDIKEEDSRFKLGDMDIQLYNYKNEYGPDGKLKRVYDDNSNSIVAVVTVAGKRIYLGGDLDNAEGAEDKLGPVIGKVDMMKWNHHYDATISNTVNFINNLSPSIVVQTSGSDINRESTRALLREKNIKIVKAYSHTKDATVFDIDKEGFTNVSEVFPNIPIVREKWYKEDGYWKYRLSDDEMTIGWRKIDGVYYFFNGQGQMQAGKWLHLKDSREKIDGNWYYLNNNGDMRETGWFNQDGNWYYITSTGARSYNELLEIAGQKYLFDKDGKMLTGYQVFNGKKMFFSESGALQTAGNPSTWQKIGSDWYFYDEDGLRTVGKKNINGSTYYFNQEGMMQTGWAFVDGHWNYFASSGAMKTGWVKEQETWYYLDKDGIMLTGRQDINGVRYYLNASGAMQTGWKWQDNSWYFYTNSGAMKTGWLKDKESWYYLDPETGIMAVGSKEIDGKNYLFSSVGTMQVGWQWSNDSWHYYATSGALQTGWLKDDDAWYYLEGKEGVMLVGLHQVDGKQYYFSRSGAMQTGWKWSDNHYRYFESNGAMKTGWIKDKGVWYYLNPEDGIMLVGLHKVNGEHYYFDETGAMETGWKQIDSNWYYFQADGSLLKNATTPDGYKVNEEGIWKISQTTVAVEQDKKEQITETSTSAENSSHVEDNSSHPMIEE
ncbi:MBL fold metallo-hydrolase [Streptococcus oralis]|uniref:MBL fold metallo-hydrolase n=1 Tax=Streptococcus oralis TaxID=1303 RepID=UPI0020019C2D|nr:MBL fold metallo-hydrolase [Streptococcus oralis]